MKTLGRNVGGFVMLADYDPRWGEITFVFAEEELISLLHVCTD